MSIKSGRQFRSYIISWFLMIVGLIVYLGSTMIWDRAQAYLLDNYLNVKTQQMAAMASMVNATEHAKLRQYHQQKSRLFQSLEKTINLNSKSSQEKTHIFSLNFNPKSKQTEYAVDTRRSDRDSLRVSSELFDLLLSLNDQGQLELVRRPLYGQAERGNNQVENTQIELRQDNQKALLMVNGQVILTINPRVLHGQFQKLSINAKTLTAKQVELELPQLTRVSYRYIPKGGLLNPPGAPFVADNKILQSLNQALKQGKSGLIAVEPQKTVSDYLVFAAVEKNAGALVMHVPATTLTEISRQFLQSFLLIFSLMAVLILIAAIFFARKITRPLEELNLAISRLVQNDFNFKLSSKGFGSFRFIANQFNQMLVHIQRSRNEMIALNKSYSRFVPHQLLKQLGVASVSDIALGDCCEREMTVLFCDIRGFTTLSESMTPQANFNFINRYLSQIAPVINKRGGIIDKYLGDGIMALFPNGADQALKAAIEMLSALDQYNEKLRAKKLPIVEVGLGLHSGSMMLGTVGTSSRMDATVVSDTVNAAARVESMTKAFCTKILITEETKRQLEDINAYKMRYIASCRIRGKSKPVTLYEVFDNDSISLQNEKSANQSVMIRAWKKYRQGDVASAVALYQRQIEKSPEDKSLFALIERCQSGRL